MRWCGKTLGLFDYRVAMRAAICACRLALLLFETISAAALARLRCTVGEKVMTPGRSLIAGTLLAATPASAQRQPPPFEIVSFQKSPLISWKEAKSNF